MVRLPDIPKDAAGKPCLTRNLRLVDPKALLLLPYLEPKYELLYRRCIQLLHDRKNQCVVLVLDEQLPTGNLQHHAMRLVLLVDDHLGKIV